MSIRQKIKDIDAQIGVAREKHDEIGAKFHAYKAPLVKQCDQHLKRTKFAPFMAVLKAQDKAAAAQNATIAEIRRLEHEREKLVQQLLEEPEPSHSIEPGPVDESESPDADAAESPPEFEP